jgi:hypothetical protein
MKLKGNSLLDEDKGKRKFKGNGKKNGTVKKEG